MTFSARDFQEAPLDDLLREATHLREKRFDNRIELCSIVNVKSGRCPMDCRFCAQSGHHPTGVNEYPLLDGETLRSETEAFWKQGVHRVGWVASGGAVGKDDLENIADSAGRLHRNGGLCASLGRLDTDSLRRLRESGFSRYHHNLETSERFYPSICSTQRWRARFDTIRRAKELGFEVCSGGLFGLGETWQDRVDLAFSLRELQVDSVPINFLTPIPGTPLSGREPPRTEEGLRIIALFRILLPETSIRICGGRSRTLQSRQAELFDAGADALMTGNYLTTTGETVSGDRALLQEKHLRPVNKS